MVASEDQIVSIIKERIMIIDRSEYIEQLLAKRWNGKVNMLSIDSVVPSKESLKNNTYPFVSSIYAAIRETESQESMAHKLFQFIFTKSGADMIDESGYIAIKD